MTLQQFRSEIKEGYFVRFLNSQDGVENGRVCVVQYSGVGVVSSVKRLDEFVIESSVTVFCIASVLPLEITTERLLKLGFKYFLNGFDFYLYPVYVVRFMGVYLMVEVVKRDEENTFVIIEANPWQSFVDVQYVHELQRYMLKKTHHLWPRFSLGSADFTNL